MGTSAPPSDVRTIDLEGRASTASVAEVATLLRQLSGRSLVVHIVGSDDQGHVDEWADGRATPPDEITRRMRNALGIVDLLLEVERPAVVRAWFGGRNRMLDDRPPALLLRTEPETVWRAARAFRAYG